MSAKVIHLSSRRFGKKAKAVHEMMYSQMDKLELLEEMVKFQEERSLRGHLTLEMMQRGLVLFEYLERSAETEEMRLLTRSYQRHLKHELENYKPENPAL